jgi:hypothetical protein
MQPTLPQNTGAGDMDLSAVQSMDWLFKKERIYLLAQFWQQVSDLLYIFFLNLQIIVNGFHLFSCTPLKQRTTIKTNH